MDSATTMMLLSQDTNQADLTDFVVVFGLILFVVFSNRR